MAPKREAAAAKKSGSGATGTHAAHSYSLEEYGMEKAEVKERLGWYYDSYL